MIPISPTPLVSSSPSVYKYSAGKSTTLCESLHCLFCSWLITFETSVSLHTNYTVVALYITGLKLIDWRQLSSNCSPFDCIVRVVCIMHLPLTHVIVRYCLLQLTLSIDCAHLLLEHVIKL